MDDPFRVGADDRRPDTNMAELPIACTLTPETLRTRREGLLTDLVRRAERRKDLSDGVHLEFAPSGDTIALIARVVDAERHCCRFLRFGMTVEPDGGPVCLDLSRASALGTPPKGCSIGPRAHSPGGPKQGGPSNRRPSRLPLWRIRIAGQVHRRTLKRTATPDGGRRTSARICRFPQRIEHCRPGPRRARGLTCCSIEPKSVSGRGERGAKRSDRGSDPMRRLTRALRLIATARDRRPGSGPMSSRVD